MPEPTCGFPVLVFGGSSQIGHFLLPRLLARGASVTALSRRAHASRPGLHWLQGGLPDALPRELPHPSAIVSFGPLMAFAEWLSRADFGSEPPRVIATSSRAVGRSWISVSATKIARPRSPSISVRPKATLFGASAIAWRTSSRATAAARVSPVTIASASPVATMQAAKTLRSWFTMRWQSRAR